MKEGDEVGRSRPRQVDKFGSSCWRRRDALADFTNAIDKQPELSFCYFNRGSLYLVIGEFEKAISDLTEALGDAKVKAIALSRRGQAYETLGQRAQALDDFRVALELDPNLESAKEGFFRLTNNGPRASLHRLSRHSIARRLFV